MRKFAIVTDATADLTPEYVRDHSITVLPMEFTLWDKRYIHYPDERELPCDEYFNALKSGGVTKTTQINLMAFTDCFQSIVRLGMDVLYIGFSSGISGTYNVSCMARNDVLEEYPDAKIVCVDSLSTTVGLGLLVRAADELRSAGKSLDETAAWLSEHVITMHHWFMVDDLQHLRRGGRVSSLEATLGTALGIKPVLKIGASGALDVTAKVRGSKKAIEYLADRYDELCTDKTKTVCVVHAANPLGAMSLCAELSKRGAEVTEVARLSPIVGAHTGPGLLGVTYFGRPRE